MSKSKVKAIETEYAGCRFRSRLEARWAMVFDHLDIRWHYEPEGFDTPAGRYLPDFHLYELGRWVEIKGGSFTQRDRDRGAWFGEHCWQQGEGYRVLLGDIPRTAGFGVPALMWSMAAWPLELLEQENMSLPALVREGEIAIAGTPDEFAWAELNLGTLPDTATCRRDDGGHEFRFFRGDLPGGKRELPGGLQVFYPGDPLPWLVHPDREPASSGPGHHLEWGDFRDFIRSVWVPAAPAADIDAALTAARSARFGT